MLYHPVHVVMQPNSLCKFQTDCDIMLYSVTSAACIRGAELGPFQGKRLLSVGRALLATHSEVQAKVVAELGAAGLLAKNAKSEARGLTYADLGRLPYLDAVRIPLSDS